MADKYGGRNFWDDGDELYPIEIENKIPGSAGFEPLGGKFRDDYYRMPEFETPEPDMEINFEYTLPNTTPVGSIGRYFDGLKLGYKIPKSIQRPAFRVESTDPGAVLRAGDMATYTGEDPFFKHPISRLVSRLAIVQTGARLDPGADKLESDPDSVVCLEQTIRTDALLDPTDNDFRDAEIRVVTYAVSSLAVKKLVFKRPSTTQ